MEEQFTQNPIQEPVPVSASIPVKNNNFSVAILGIFVLILIASTGFLFYQNQQLKAQLLSFQTQPTASPTPVVFQSPIPSTTTDSATANWKTYTNTQNFYSFRYPDTVYSIQESAQNAEYVHLFKGPVDHFEVEVTQITDSIENWFKKEKNNGQFSDEFFVSSQSTFQNYPALLIQSIPGALEYPTDIFIVKNNNRIYKIAFTKEGSDKIIVDQILSTFKFTK